MRSCKVYFKPIVEHNSVVSSSHTLQDINAIERVQKRFSKRLSGLRECSYEVRLKGIWLCKSLETVHQTALYDNIDTNIVGLLV